MFFVVMQVAAQNVLMVMFVGKIEASSKCSFSHLFNKLHLLQSRFWIYQVKFQVLLFRLPIDLVQFRQLRLGYAYLLSSNDSRLLGESLSISKRIKAE